MPISRRMHALNCSEAFHDHLTKGSSQNASTFFAECCEHSVTSEPPAVSHGARPLGCPHDSVWRGLTTDVRRCSHTGSYFDYEDGYVGT